MFYKDSSEEKLNLKDLNAKVEQIKESIKVSPRDFVPISKVNLQLQMYL